MGVPASYIKYAPVDWEGELHAAYALPSPVGCIAVPPITFGVWSLLEMAECNYVHPHQPATVDGRAMALYIAANAQKVAHEVYAWAEQGRPDSGELVANARLFAERSGAKEEDWRQFDRMLEVSTSGFAMLPGEGGNSSANLYGLDTFASVIAGVGPLLGLRWDEVMWGTPMAVIGHVCAQMAKQNGAKGVARPKDPGDIREQLRLYRKRREAGTLHPWQEKEPLWYGLEGHESDGENYRWNELNVAAAAAEEKRKEEERTQKEQDGSTD